MLHRTEVELQWDCQDVIDASRHPDVLRLGGDSVAAHAASGFLEACAELEPGQGNIAFARTRAMERLIPRERKYYATAGFGISVAIRALAQTSGQRPREQAAVLRLAS